MSDYGYKISLPGYDVKTATPEQCAVHSSYPAPKVWADPTKRHYGQFHINFVTTPATGTSWTLATIPHGFSYTPMVLGHVIYSSATPNMSGSYILPWIPFITPPFGFAISADATNIYLRFYYNSTSEPSMAGRTADISYYCFAENGA